MEMSSEAYDTDAQAKSPDIDELLLFDGDPEDNDDSSGDYDEEDCLRGLEYFELKDLDADSLSLLNSILCEEEASSDATDHGGAGEEAGLKIPHTAEEAEDDIDSEEEENLLKEIKDEVESNVNNIHKEIKDELKDYSTLIKILEVEQSGKTDDERCGKTEEYEEDMDPKLQEAIIKMNKLDKILLKKIQREKQVKRDRILLERCLRQEISEMNKEASLQDPVKINTEKFLALTLPAKHNEGVNLEDEEYNLPPLFTTQIDESETLQRKSNRTSNNGSEESKPGESGSGAWASRKNSGSGTSKASLEGKHTRQKRDFIKRNKELAANADYSVAMTDDDKKRLAELLEGVDELPEFEEPLGEDSLRKSNGTEVTHHLMEGYLPDENEMKSLSSIDERLKEFMPEDKYMSVVQHYDTSQAPRFQQPMQTQDGVSGLPERFGERALYEAKDERELKERLQAIEQELDKFKAQNEEGLAEEVSLTDEQLNSLLDQCARNMALPLDSETQDMSAGSSSWLITLENPPKLTDEQLQKLLSEAHFPLSSKLLALQEDDQRIMEESSNAEAITAETWKAISSINLDEECNEASPSLGIEDDETPLEMADIAYLNISNNHNRNMSASNTENEDQGQSSGKMSGEILSGLSPTGFSVANPVQNSTHSGTVKGSQHESHNGLPRISLSNGISVLDKENGSSNEMPIFSRENTEDVKLPNIPTKSFLIHSPQGINNIKEKDKNNLSSKQPLQMVWSDLSDVRTDDVSCGRDGGMRGQGHPCGSSSKTSSGHQAKHPLNNKWHSKV